MAVSAERGLCADCCWAREVPTRNNGPVYLRCGRAERDPAFPKYPRLPVLECRGYEPGTE